MSSNLCAFEAAVPAFGAAWGFFLLCLTDRRMKEGRGEGGEKLPSSDFKRKSFQVRYGLMLKEGKHHKQELPCCEIPNVPVAPQGRPNQAGSADICPVLLDAGRSLPLCSSPSSTFLKDDSSERALQPHGDNIQATAIQHGSCTHGM